MMKKLLLSLFAAVLTLGAYAYEANQYVYTSAARYKLTQLVASSDFTSLEGWTIISGSESSTVEDFGSIEEGAGPDGANEFKFSSALATNGFYLKGAASIGKTYLLTFKARNADAAFTSVVTAAAQNRVALVCNATDDEAVSSEDPVSSESSETVVIGQDWTDCAISVVDTLSENENVVAVLAGLPVNTEIADVEIWEVESVYDIRPVGKALDYAALLMADENFNTADYKGEDSDFEGKKAVEALEATYSSIKEMYDNANESCELDDEATGTDLISGLNEAIEIYLDASATDLSGILTGVSSTYWTAKGKYNRGSMGDTDFGGVKLGHGSHIDGNTDNNWQHSANSDALFSAIQTSYTNRDQTWTVENEKFPAGKYFFTCEMMNAKTGKSSTYVYDYSLVDSAYVTVGTAQETVVLSGNEWTKVYLVGDVDYDGNFKVEVAWNPEGTYDNGGAFWIKNCQIRAFDGENVATQYEHKTKFEAFKTQYDAATTARKNLLSLKGDKNYPYGQNTIDPTVEKWDQYYSAAASWVDEDGNDSGAATTEELADWVILQGVYAAEDTVGFGEQGVDKNTYQYPVVRGYQLAYNNIVNLRAHFTTLAATIETAETVLADAMYVNGDKATFKEIIANAKSLLNSTLAAAVELTADSAEWKNDTTVIYAANQILLIAIDAFKESGELKPVININFDSANAVFTPVYVVDEETGAATEDVDHYEIAGVDGKGKMIFASNTINADNATGCYLYQLGKSGTNTGVLHMGNSNVYVPLENIDPLNDVLKVEFDCYYGQLNKGYFQFGLTNTASNTLTFGTNEFGGIKFQCYNGTVANNTIFAADGGTLDNALVQGVPSSKSGDNNNVAESNRTHYVLTYDLKARTCKAEWTGKYSNGSPALGKTGYETTMPTPADGNLMPQAMVFGCTGYNYADARRMWLDNVVIYQYKSQATEAVKGDVNGDGGVDVADVNSVISVICSGEENSSADVNGDGGVDVADVNSVISIICAQ